MNGSEFLSVNCLNSNSEDIQKAYILQRIQYPFEQLGVFPPVINILARTNCPLSLVDFAIANGAVISPKCPGALFNVAYSKNKERVCRAIDLGFINIILSYQKKLRNSFQITQNLDKTISFRLNARKLVIITIGQRRLRRAQLNKPGFIGICKIIARRRRLWRLVWSARFRGSEWE